MEICRAPLSYDFMDDLAQLYYNSNNVILNKRIQYNYLDLDVRNTIDGIWTNGYKIISATNNVLKHLENVDVESSDTYKAIKGEAHAMRAMMHFDLTRLFSENILENSQANGIPYLTTFSLESPVTRPLGETYTKIINDLLEAEQWLTFDESNNLNYDEGENTSDNYLSNRFARLNLYVVKALLARVYFTKGDVVNAKKYALEVVNSGKYVLSIDAGIGDNKKYPSGKECILGLYARDLHNAMYDKFLRYKKDKPFDNLSIVRSDIDAIYEKSSFTGENNDFRYQAYFTDVSGSIKGLKRFVEDDLETAKENKTEIGGITLIRLPEMYYILAESAYDTDINAAKNYLDEVRNSRGLLSIDLEKIDVKSEFIKEILNERLREFWGEGLIFYDYKRLNQNIVDYEMNVIYASKDIYVFPLPENEIEFGN
jgi:hypothetical protein